MLSLTTCLCLFQVKDGDADFYYNGEFVASVRAVPHPKRSAQKDFVHECLGTVLRPVADGMGDADTDKATETDYVNYGEGLNGCTGAHWPLKKAMRFPSP